VICNITLRKEGGFCYLEQVHANAAKMPLAIGDIVEGRDFDALDDSYRYGLIVRVDSIKVLGIVREIPGEKVPFTPNPAATPQVTPEPIETTEIDDSDENVEIIYSVVIVNIGPSRVSVINTLSDTLGAETSTITTIIENAGNDPIPVASVTTLGLANEIADNLRNVGATVDVLISDKKVDIGINEPTEQVKEYIGDFWISPEIRLLMADMKVNLQENVFPNFQVLLYGPPGNGKTALCEIIAEQLGLKYARIDCPTVSSSQTLFGHKNVNDTDGVVYEEKKAIDAMRNGNALVVLDEFNRLQDPTIQNMFNMLFQERKGATDNWEFECGPNVVFIATANIGLKYVSVTPLDNSVTDRFSGCLKIDNLPENVEKDLITRIVGNDTYTNRLSRILTTLRSIEEYDVGTRTVIDLARWLKLGRSVEDAIKIKIINPIADDESLQKEIIDITQGL
jgi:hypothetical protein